MTSNPFKKFLGPEAIVAVIERAASELGKTDFALCGGAAMQVYGSDRLTKDVDFLAYEVPPFLKSRRRLTFGGSAGTVDGVPTDFIVRNDDYAPLYEEALEMARYDSNIGCQVVRPAHLAAMKLAARRDKDELDLKFLLASKVVPLKEARIIVGDHLGRYAVDELDDYEKEVRLMGFEK